MLRSMTAFAKVQQVVEGCEIVVEIQGVNRRHFDLDISLPPSMRHLEPSLRRAIAECTGRGAVRCVVQAAFPGSARLALQVTASAARELADLFAAEGIALTPREAALELMRLPGMVELRPGAVDAHWETCVQQQVAQCLALFDAERLREGDAIRAALASCLSDVRAAWQQLQQRKELPLQKMRERLMALLQECGAVDAQQVRLLQQCAELAEKCDVTEEVARIGFHLLEVERLLVEKNGERRVIGKQIDFLLQELQREWNTLGNKITDGEIALCVVAAKSAIERMREQVQNVA